ncbi:MAG: hypothetical protein HY704_04945 [Gemmatimonadetes bacterium]|nr:hypothetical protein [Gemmatimonadota bacterium]
MSHYGVDAFQLFQVDPADEEWEIPGVAYTRCQSAAAVGPAAAAGRAEA